MTDDATHRERALEARIARLEERLARLEAARSAIPNPPAQAAAMPPSVAPAAPVAPAPAAPVAPAPVAPVLAPAPAPAPAAPLVTYWQLPGGKRPAPAPAASSIIASAPPASAAAASTPAASSAPTFRLPNLTGSINDLEDRLAGRALAWAGGIALVLGAIFFLSLAFSRGWIGPELRVALGLVAGSLALAGGAAFMERDNRLLGHVLTPVGLAIISISLVGATSLYHLVPVEVGLLGALLSAIAAAVIAVRSDSQVVAGFGLVAVLIAPPIMGAPADITTLLFVAVVLVGTTGIALWRSWSWLPPVAFVLSAPQAAAWVNGDPGTALGLVGIWGFWLLNIVAAGGEAFRRRRNDLSASSASLLLANVGFLLWAGFSILSGDLEAYRTVFLVAIAAAHLGIGGFFVARDGDSHLFGLLAIGTGIAAVTMAVPIQLGASAVPVAWTAEAAALAWLAARRGHPYSAFVSGILYALASIALLRVFGLVAPSAEFLTYGHWAALGFYAVGVGVGVWFLRDKALRSVLVASGLTVAAGCTRLVLDAPLHVIALTVLLVTGMAALRLLPRLPSAPIEWHLDGLIPSAYQSLGGYRQLFDIALPVVAAGLGTVATVDLISRVYEIPSPPAGTIPFIDPSGLALAVYLAGLAIATWLSGESRLRSPIAAVGLLVTAWACVAVLDDVELVAALSLLMLVGFLVELGLGAVPHRTPLALGVTRGIAWTTDHALPVTAALVGVAAALHIVLFELPLAEIESIVLPAIPFSDAGAAAAAALLACVLGSGYVRGGAMARRASFLIAGSIAAYAVPFQVAPWAVVVLWVALAGLWLAIAVTDSPARTAYQIAAAVMVGDAAFVALRVVAPPTRLVVGSTAVEPVAVLQMVAALGAVVVGFALLARAGRREPWARWAWLLAGVSFVYLVSVAVVQIVATQVGGATATEELRTQGQVALSVTWAVLGVASFVAGLRLRIDDLRHAGLALLALAAAKVFLFDLAALDVAYRVISLIALGLLLLASAWLWQRLGPQRPAPSDAPETPAPPDPEVPEPDPAN